MKTICICNPSDSNSRLQCANSLSGAGLDWTFSEFPDSEDEIEAFRMALEAAVSSLAKGERVIIINHEIWISFLQPRVLRTLDALEGNYCFAALASNKYSSMKKVVEDGQHWSRVSDLVLPAIAFDVTFEGAKYLLDSLPQSGMMLSGEINRLIKRDWQTQRFLSLKNPIGFQSVN